MNERKSIWQRLTGGWRTWGPSSGGSDVGGMRESPEDMYSLATADTALKLSAVKACVELRAETIGSLPVGIRDGKKNIVTDHPAQYLIAVSPNLHQTPSEFWSMTTGQVDMVGNSVCIIERAASGKPTDLIPYDAEYVQVTFNKSGSRKTWKIDGEKVKDENVFHNAGFSLNGGWGASRLEMGRHIIGAQLAANDAAMKLYKTGLKVGGFFDQSDRAQQLDDIETAKFLMRLRQMALPENLGKGLLLPKGVKPLPNTSFMSSAVDAELLQSRYFGIEEICRLFNVPPQLIYHFTKSSSWASSIENINLFFLMYSLMPTLIRYEDKIMKKLMTPQEVAKGLQPKFNIAGLLRGDQKTRNLAYATGLQNGYLSQNEVRELEDRASIGPEGDIYRVQLNMASAEDEKDDDKPNKTAEEGDDK